MAYCGRCGAMLGEGRKFCGGCGEPVVTRATPAATAATPEAAAPVLSRKGMTGPAVWVALAISGLVMLGAGGWLAYPILKKRFGPESPMVTGPAESTPGAGPRDPGKPPTAEVVKEPEGDGVGPGVQPSQVVVAPEEREAGVRAAEARRNAERAASERAAAERAAGERLAQERAAGERLAQERAAGERLAQERAAQEREAAERQAQERAAQTRLAREAEEKQQAARRAAEAGPRSGVLTWQGRLAKGEVVTITGPGASTGEVSGEALPGGVVILHSRGGCTVSSAPVPSSGFKQFSFRCKQAGAVTAEFSWTKP